MIPLVLASAIVDLDSVCGMMMEPDQYGRGSCGIQSHFELVVPLRRYEVEVHLLQPRHRESLEMTLLRGK